MSETTIDALYESLQRTKLQPLELDQLVPMIEGQMQYLKETLSRVKGIAQDPGTMRALKDVFPKIVRDPSGDSEADAQAYLKEIATQIDYHFTGPIDEILGEQAAVRDLITLRRWLTRVGLVASSIARNKSVLFVYKARSFVTGKNERTKEVLTVPNEWAVSLYPFEVAVEECARVAEAMQESIASWNKTQQEAVLRLSDLRAAEASRDSGRRQLWIQLWLIPLTLALSYFVTTWQDSGANWRARRDLARSLGECRDSSTALDSRVTTCTEQLNQERKEIRRLGVEPADKPVTQPSTH